MPNTNWDRPIILLVEDNPDDEAIAIRAMRQQIPHGRIAVARDGQAAIDCTKGTLSIEGNAVSATPQLILLDLKLPKVPGLEVLRLIRDSDRMSNVPVVVFSSSDEPRDVDQAYAFGANTYVRKPTEYDAYVDAMKDLTSYWFTLATLPTAKATG